MPESSVAPDKQTANEIFVKELEAAQSLEDVHAIVKPKDWSIDAYLEHLHRIMRQRITLIKTPEDGIVTQQYFAINNVYSRVIQEELADKIRDVIAKWHPNTAAFREGVTHKD